MFRMFCGGKTTWDVAFPPQNVSVSDEPWLGWAGTTCELALAPSRPATVPGAEQRGVRSLTGLESLRDGMDVAVRARVLVAVLGAVLASALLWSTPAAAEPGATGPALVLTPDQVTLKPGDPVAFTATVTNPGQEPCLVTTLAEAGLHLSGLTRDGVAVPSTLVTTRYINGFTSAASAGAVTVAPGETATLRFAATSTDQFAPGPVLATTEPVAGGDALTALWSVGAAGGYRMSVVYRSPELAGAVPACAGSSPAAVVEFTVGDPDQGGQRLILLVAGAVVGLTVVMAIVVVVRRRRTGPAAAVLLVLAAVAPALSPPAAEAAVILPPGSSPFATDLNGCLQGFQIDPATGDPAGIMPGVVSVDTPSIFFIPTTGESTSRSTPSGTTLIEWNPNDRSELQPGVPQVPCATLYHELFHAWEAGRGESSDEACEATRTGVGKKGAPITIDEVQASLAENAYRRTHGLPARTQYDGHPLPRSVDDCGPINKPRGRPPACEAVNSASCGMSNGDPHLATFDRRRFDLQAVGEFVLARSGADMEVQARQAPFPDSRTVSVNTALAVRAGQHRLGFTLVDDGIEVRQDGAVVTLADGDTALPGEIVLSRWESNGGGDGYSVRWPDGSMIDLDPISSYGIRLYAAVSPARAGTMTGLLGDADGDPANDLAPKGGPPLGESPTFEQLHRAFGDSWRIAQPESLFDYPAGKDTSSYDDRSFPDRQVGLADLTPQQRDQATAICRRLGVTDPGLLEDCVLDVAVTGQPAFAINSRDTQRTVPERLLGTAGATTLSITRPGDQARLSFPGTPGQRVFVEVPSTNLPDECSPLALLDPAGALVRSGCIIGGKGYIDGTVLEAGGQYTVVLQPGTATGQANVRVITGFDQDGDIVADGSAVTSTIARPGEVGRFRFTAAAGQKVFVDVPSSTLADECSPLMLLDPAGEVVRSGCVIGGSGLIDGTVLATAGQHTVVVDPGVTSTGVSQLRLVTVVDETGPIDVNGSERVATIAQPGGTSRLTFGGTAGQRLTVDASSSTLVDECGLITVRDAADQPIASGCVISGQGGIAEVVLPTSGPYSIVVDPAGRTTGSLRLRLRTTA